jgi:hypothetical protein
MMNRMEGNLIYIFYIKKPDSRKYIKTPKAKLSTLNPTLLEDKHSGAM